MATPVTFISSVFNSDKERNKLYKLYMLLEIRSQFRKIFFIEYHLFICWFFYLIRLRSSIRLTMLLQFVVRGISL